MQMYSIKNIHPPDAIMETPAAASMVESAGELPALKQRFRLTFAYDIHFTQGLFRADNSLLSKVTGAAGDNAPNKILVVIDDGLLRQNRDLSDQIDHYAACHGDALRLAADPLIVPGGEGCKTTSRHVSRIHEQVHRASICRHSYIMAIGGGAVLDMAGFAAATAHRGIRLLRIPTTVLSQNDSGIGVKNGVNAFAKKNFLGTFNPPSAVINDFDFLRTLDDRDWRAGTAEAVKVALLKDRDFFVFIEARAAALARREMEPMRHLIHRCAGLHMAHIADSGDPFETGCSRPLDFGHWSAHKLEQLSEYRLRHGEAVAIGLALDCVYSNLTGRLSDIELWHILSTLRELGFALYVPELRSRLEDPRHPRSLFAGLEEFREHLGGRLTLMLLDRVGHGVEVHQVDPEIYRKAVEILERTESTR